MQGGVGAFTQELALALAAAGHQVFVITDRRARLATERPRWQDLGAPISHPFGSLYPVVHKWRWSALTQITDLALRYELDVVNVQYQAAAYNMRVPAINFLPWRLKGVTKTAVTFHDLRVPYLFPKAGRLRQWVVHFMARQAHGVIVTNPADAQTLQQVGIPPAQLRQIPIGSNIPTYTPTAAERTAVRQQWGLSPEDCLLGYFGFLNASKGADTLIDALAGLDGRFHLAFIGGQTGSSDPTNQPFLAALQQQIATYGLTNRVHWTGFLPDAQVSTYLHAADLLVMPYRDGVSLRRGTLMAALAHGRPLITTPPTLPTPELVPGQTVYITPAADTPALIQAIHTVASDATLRTCLSQGAAQVAASFTWDKIAAQTATFFTDLLAHSPRD